MEFQAKQAIYLQIADYLCERILRGEWQAHAKIPSVRDLAMTIEVNPNTVVRAYNFLEDKNIIYKERGLGYFVAADGLVNAKKFKQDIFLNEHLPIVFKNMELLGMEIEQLKNLYLQNREKQHEIK
jgi:GntR family transcriptional regulator